MRLLHLNHEGDISLTLDLQEPDKIPLYAILSHTWGADADEVTFDDLSNGTDVWKSKLGYEKIKFCGEQARKDGLRYFWIDTCCINKANKAELSTAINSMFRWYCKASRCYVYLSDVSGIRFEAGADDAGSFQPLWESEFRKSRWFTRGWTLQELLAPNSVEFFCQGWNIRLGDKVSLRQIIYEITGISVSALEGAPLTKFSINERLSWNEHRQTKLEEDKAYSLLGILDVFISPFYGEGAGGAFRRLMNEVDKQEKCIQDVRLSDPRDDKKRIEITKGGLIKDSYAWVLENKDFRLWKDDNKSGSLLWIKGDPGKGKTMLLCGIIDELQHSKARTELLSFFFCQATDSRINNATAVLQGLLYMLLDQQPSLTKHIQKRQAGNSLFSDANAWIAISEIFTDVLKDPNLGTTFFIIDALDECANDLSRLLDFVVQYFTVSSRIKWIISSRNWPKIEEQLDQTEDKIRLSLELNDDSISAAVENFIQLKVSRLAQEKRYGEKMKTAVLEYLRSNAHNTFLWVALVCKNLERVAPRNVMKRLLTFPPGLNSLYERMILQVIDSDDADLCMRVLALVTAVYRPLTLTELSALLDPGQSLSNVDDDDLSTRPGLDETGPYVSDKNLMEEIVGLCGSFLTIRDDTIFFVHQSAKDFCSSIAYDKVFPSGMRDTHRTIYLRSIQVLSHTLRRDIYDLRDLGYPIEQVRPPDSDPLAASRYSCIYWIDHLCEAHIKFSDLQDIEAIDMFIQRNYLFWLEALSLCGSIPKGVISMSNLESSVEACLMEENPSIAFIDLVRDARRFIMAHKIPIEATPLQVYSSSLLFSPTSSLIRNIFMKEQPRGIQIKTSVDDGWGACLLTLEDNSSFIKALAFSPDSTRLASALGDGTIKIWNTLSGECLQTIEGCQDPGNFVAFSHDSTQLVTKLHNGRIGIWDIGSRKFLQILECHMNRVTTALFSHDSARIASALDDTTIEIWSARNGQCLQTLKGHSGFIAACAFSCDSAQLYTASFDNTVKIWDISSGECIHSANVEVSFKARFSQDCTKLALISHRSNIRIYDVRRHEDTLNMKVDDDEHILNVAFSADSKLLVSGSEGYVIKVWDVDSGNCLQIIGRHDGSLHLMAFSLDSTRIASASYEGTIKIWDANYRHLAQAHKGHGKAIRFMDLSYDLKQVATVSEDRTIKIWDVRSGECRQTLHWLAKEPPHSVKFSQDLTQVALVEKEGFITIRHTRSNYRIQTLQSSSKINSVTFSHDSDLLVSGAMEGPLEIWKISSGESIRTFWGHQDIVWSLAISHDVRQLASASEDRTIKIWAITTGQCTMTLECSDVDVWSIAFSPDSTRLVSASKPYYCFTLPIPSDYGRANYSSLFLIRSSLHRVRRNFMQKLQGIDPTSVDSTVNIWDPKSGSCLETLFTNKGVWKISYDVSGSCLLTETGAIPISAPLASSAMSVADTRSPKNQEAGIAAGGAWLTYKNKRVLWIPTDYRPHIASVSNNNICIGTLSGIFWICSFDSSEFEAWCSMEFQ